MNQNEYIIDINPARKPHNSHLILPLDVLQKLAPLLRDEILKGLINSDGEGYVILYLQLDAAKIHKLQQVIRQMEKKAA